MQEPKVVASSKNRIVNSPIIVITLLMMLLLLLTSLPNVQAFNSNSAVTANPRSSSNITSENPGCGSFYKSGTCPMGLADYGIYGKTLYNYTAPGFQSSTTFSKLSIGSSSGSYPGADVQLNAVAYGIVQGNNPGEYWTQDVARIRQSGTTFTISLADNIWNFSSHSTLTMSDGSIFGNNNGKCSSYGIYNGGSGSSYYACVGPSVSTTLPFKIVLKMYVSTSFTVCAGASGVEFYLAIYHGTTLLKSGYYDLVCLTQ